MLQTFTDVGSKLRLIKSTPQQLIWELPTTNLEPISQIKIQFKNNSDFKIISFQLQHAFNHVLSDLVLDDTVQDWSLSETYHYQFSTPVSASHVLLSIPNQQNLDLAQLVEQIQVLTVTKQKVVTKDETDHTDRAALSYQKKVWTTDNPVDAQLLTDGSSITTWQAPQYPTTADVDLQKIAQISMIQVYFPADEEVRMALYGSVDGSSFERFATRIIKQSSTAGESFQVAVQYRFIRLDVLYNSGSQTVRVHQIRILGEFIEQQAPLAELPSLPAFEQPSLTTIQALAGIVKRRLGSQYLSWFHFKLTTTTGLKADSFTLTNDENGIQISGTTGVTLATGLNYYLKYFCQVNLSEFGVGDQIQMPAKPIKLTKPLTRVTSAKYRYAFNYTTHSYSMAFWGQDEWQSELDWLALNGVNLILDTTGQEYVWAKFMEELGYSLFEIQAAISAPTYTAWQWMGNIGGVGGPSSPEWYLQRAQLARHNHQFMHALGMQPIVQGYAGQVPPKLVQKIPDVEIIPQGQWCGFDRPAILRTDDHHFSELANLFYQTQKAVFGPQTFFAVDPFHEGGNSADLKPQMVSHTVLQAMLAANPQAVWVIQSWQENPTPDLLAGIQDQKDQHALILDLYAEKTPHWSVANPAQYGGPEFGHTPWLFCMLNNFGGRMGLNGMLDTLQQGYLTAVKKAHTLIGVGITPEAIQSNPILNDFFFEMIWHDPKQAESPLNLKQWLKDYSHRRYGAVSSAAYQSLQIQLETVYATVNNQLGQGAPESVINGRPALNLATVSSWGNTEIGYSKQELIRALELLEVDFSKLKESAGYRFDLVSLAEQVLANYAQSQLRLFNQLVEEQRLNQSNRWNEIITLIDQLADWVPIDRLTTWQTAASKAAAQLDDFSQDRFQLDARRLITTWGSLRQANSGGLHDYSNRQWSGITGTLYQQRWQRWFENQNQEISAADWFKQEWLWNLNWSQDLPKYSQDLEGLIQRTLTLVQANEGERK